MALRRPGGGRALGPLWNEGGKANSQDWPRSWRGEKVEGGGERTQDMMAGERPGDQSCFYSGWDGKPMEGFKQRSCLVGFKVSPGPCKGRGRETMEVILQWSRQRRRRSDKAPLGDTVPCETWLEVEPQALLRTWMWV